MKRKIFSKLLMGAFLIASVSSFVSCKDYDDDINNLQKQIDAAALKAELTTLQTNLAAQIAAAQSAAQAAQAAAEKAQATANNAATKDALEAVKTLATTAGTDAAKAIADAANAQNTADVAKSAATAAQEAAAAAQNVANGASDKAATALADAAKALATAEAANATAKDASTAAKAAQDAAGEAKTTAGEAKATADNALAAAGNATTQAAEALKAAGEAKAAAEAAKYNDEAVKLLIAQAQASADDAAADAKDAAEAAAAAVIASASASEDAAAAKAAAAKIDEAIAEATKAINEATDAKIKAAVAEVVADQVKVDGSQDAAQTAAIEKLQGDLKTLADAQGKLATAEGLSAAVTALEGKLEGAADAAAAAAVAAAAGTIDAAVAELYAAVTSVELVASFTGWNLIPDADSQTYPLGFTASTSTSIDLDFIFGKQEFTATFGDKETENLDDDAVEKISYKKGDDIRANRALLIRVNPVNATFTKDQVKFINSKLETLDEIVEIGDPYRFKGMITRSSQESGLWVIPVSVKKDVTYNDFNKTTWYKASGDWKYDKVTGDVLYQGLNKLYAVAINNTPDMDDAEGVSRYVASTYDVAANYVHYQPAHVLDALFEWTLDDKDYLGTTVRNGVSDNGTWYGNTIHNRWTTYANYSDPTSGVRSKDQSEAYSIVEACHEKAWSWWGGWSTDYSGHKNSDQYKQGLVTPNAYEPNKPTEKTLKGVKYYDAVDDGSDYRFNYNYLTVASVGDHIKVYLTSALQKKVEYWYISFDFEHNAVESKPSEWEAWQSYQDGIEGIYKTVPGDKPIDLVVNKATAQGDVIGFRIWAVNYDGSLVDPDGKAFYIKLGEEPEAQTLSITASVMAVNAATSVDNTYLVDEDKTYTADKGYNVSTITKIDGNTFKSLNDWSSFSMDRNYSTLWSSGFSRGMRVYSFGSDDDIIYNGTSVRVYYVLLKSDKKTPATDWKDVAYIKAGIVGADLVNMRDGATLNLGTFTGTRKDVNNPETYKMTVKVTKQMPDDAFTKKNFFDGMITWKTDYGWDPATNVLTTYVKPYYDLMAYGLDYLKPHFVKGTGGAADVFNWRWQGASAATMASWINDKEWLNWDYSVNTNPANAGVRMIDDYIASVKPEVNKALYKWVIKGLPTQLTGNGVPTSKDYTAKWITGVADQDFADNGVMAVMPKAVREDAQFNSELKYTYKNVSATNKWDNGTLVWDRPRDLDRNANTFKTDFKDAMDLLTYTTGSHRLIYDVWAKNAIDVPYIVDTKQVLDNNVYIDWLGTNGGTNLATFAANTDFNANLFRVGFVDMRESAVGTAASQSFNPNTFDKFATLAAGTNDLTSLMTSIISDPNKVLAENKQMIANICNGAGVDRDNAADGTFGNANKFAFNENHYKFDDPNRKATDPVVTAMKIELEGAITTYLKVSPTATPTAMVFQKIGGVQDPHQNVAGNIKLSGFDVFGKKHIFNIPVVIIFNK